MENRYLAHYGIKGMKWGIWNEETRARYRGWREKNKKSSHERLLKSTNAKKLYNRRKELSDRELQDRLNRLNKENELKRLAYKDSAAKKIVKAVEGMTIAAISAYIFNSGKKYITDNMDNLKTLYDIYGSK